MKIDPTTPPRRFQVGFDGSTTLTDCASISLDPNEQVTFLTTAGGQYDVVRKDWGFYATPSLNGRLKRFGFRSALVKNRGGQFFLLLVEEDKLALFEDYRESERLKLVAWLDSDESIGELLSGKPHVHP